MAGGKVFEWDAEITQIVPGESIGWKSVSGSKNTGRINFARIGNDTLVHVQMNYVPATRLLRPMLAGMSGQIEGYIEQALRDFKHALEAGERSRGGMPSQATGTHGPETLTRNTNEKYGSPSIPVEYTRPPEAKY